MSKHTVVASNEQAVKLATELIEQAETGGLEITITIPPPAKKSSDHARPETTPDKRLSIRERKRQDLAWLQVYMTQNPDELSRLRNHYVAVFNRQIVSIGDSKELVLIGAAAALSVMPDDLLIVPVQVMGSESEDDWLQAKRDLGIA